MAFATESGKGQLMAEINVTPLVDVMLVLLIIFIVTVPVLTHQIDIALPQPTPNRVQPVVPPPPIELRIDAGGQAYWNNNPVALVTLQAMMENEVRRDPTNQPELRIDTSPDAQYDAMAKVLAAAKNAQMQKIIFAR